MSLFAPRPFETSCRIAVEQSPAAFHAHVELAGDVAIGPGDRVRVHGDALVVPFGASMVIERTATVRPAGALRRAWTRAAAYLDLKELYEVSFSAGRLG